MAYQDKLNNYFNELVNTFKTPLNISDKQKIFSPLDIINASFIIIRKYKESTQTSGYSFSGEYTNPNSYVFCSGTGDTYRFLSLPFILNMGSIETDEEGRRIIEVGNIVTGESTKLLCLDKNFNIIKLDEDFNINENGNDCIISVTDWDAENRSGKYLIPYPFDYLIFVQVRDESQEVTNNG